MPVKQRKPRPVSSRIDPRELIGASRIIDPGGMDGEPGFFGWELKDGRRVTELEVLGVSPEQLRPRPPPHSPERQALVAQFRSQRPDLRSGRAQWEAYAARMEADPTLPALAYRDFATTKAKPGRKPNRKPTVP
jgi:hypothetical protein